MSPVVLFDGECALCDASVRWIQARDRRGIFECVPRTSPAALAALRDAPERIRRADAIVMVEGGRSWAGSAAVIEVLRRLGLPWSLAVLAYAVPRPARDVLYASIARNRHAVGSDHRVPPPETRKG